MVFFLNNTPSSNPLEGTPAQRFFGRTPKVNIAGSHNAPVSPQARLDMLKRRQERQEKALSAKGKTTHINYKKGDKVRIFNSYQGVWNIKGEIIEEIPGEDGQARSFLIKDEEDNEIWRNSKFIKLRQDPPQE